jgi:DNA-binding response OmpR family regulator
MERAASTHINHVVALINASDDIVDIVQRTLRSSGFTCLIGCRLADLKKGYIDFARYLRRHEPDVVIFDIAPPYVENWIFFKTLREAQAMEGRGLLLTTTNRARLNETVGEEVEALELAGKPGDLAQITAALHAALPQAR